MKINIFFVLICLVFRNSYSQDYIDVLTLPKPDSTGKIWNSFYDNKNKIMVLSDIYKNDNEYKRMYGYFLLDTALRAKNESELSKEDYNRPLLIFGPINGFKNWDKFEVPVKKLMNGFEFFAQHYYGKDDGVYYSSSNRMIYSGNSLVPVWELQSQFELYHYTIVSNNERIILGEYLPEKSFQIDLISIRNNNYSKITTKDFILYISKKLNTSLITKNVKEIDSISSEICNRLKIKPVTDPIICYVHSEPNEATFFANFYNMQGYGVLPADRTFGTVFMKQLHCVGFSIGLIKHEGFHLIWEKSVGLSINSFFMEGIQGYYGWGHDTSIVNNNISIIQKHLDYDMTNLVAKGDMQSFWGGPAENNWPIAYPLSGLFVKYLVDNWGLELFKEMYLIEDKNIAFKRIYNKSVNELILDFRNEIQNN